MGLAGYNKTPVLTSNPGLAVRSVDGALQYMNAVFYAEQDYQDVFTHAAHFVAVSDTGYGAYSTDGIYWYGLTNLLPYYHYTTITSSATGFAVASSQGYMSTVSRITRSSNGFNWAGINTAIPTRFQFVDSTAASTDNGEHYLFVGTNTSDSSRSWFIFSESSTLWYYGAFGNTALNPVQCCGCGNGNFIVFGSNGVGYHSTSPTQSWSQITIPNIAFSKITYSNANGRFVAVGNNQGAISTNGTSWSLINLPTGNYSSVCYGNGRFVAVSLGYNRVISSTDGQNWSTHNLPEVSNWSSVTFGRTIDSPDDAHGIFVAISKTSATAYSSDGTTWTAGQYLPNLPRLSGTLLGSWVSVTNKTWTNA